MREGGELQIRADSQRPGGDDRDRVTEPPTPSVHRNDPGGSVARNRSPLREKAVLGAGIVAGVIGLGMLARDGTRPARLVSSEDGRGGGIIVREEVTMVWLPREWAALASTESTGDSLRSPEALRAHLASSGPRDRWYALVLKGHQRDGKSVTRTFIRVPRRDPEILKELHGVLIVAAGAPRPSGFMDYTTTRFMLIPPELECLDAEAVFAKHSLGDFAFH
ncbi:MAG: hypothetical protein AB7I30_23530 [Isosphaeraceae bacterium]